MSLIDAAKQKTKKKIINGIKIEKDRKIKLSTILSNDMYHSLKIKAIKENVIVSDLIRKWISEYIK